MAQFLRAHTIGVASTLQPRAAFWVSCQHITTLRAAFCVCSAAIGPQGPSKSLVEVVEEERERAVEEFRRAHQARCRVSGFFSGRSLRGARVGRLLLGVGVAGQLGGGGAFN